MSDKIIDQTDAIHCRASAGTAIPAAKKWEAGVPVSFMYLPAGVTTITAGFRDKAIKLTVLCDETTADAVQASYDDWLTQFPKQKPFGCIEHEEKAASVWPQRFEWRDGEQDAGVYMAAEPSDLGAKEVNGKVRRSWSPSFLTDADYAKAADSGSGVLEFEDGARGSAGNPARVTGIAFCVGTLTNKPAFKNISPVKAKQADGVVQAAGTSEGAIEGWKHRYRGNDGQDHSVQFGPTDHVEERQAFKSAQKKIIDHGHNKYFDSIPVNEHADILEKHGFSGRALDGIYTGREGHADAQVGPKTMHHVSWYKMPSGRYEITAYMSHGKNIADQGGWKHLGQGEQTQATSATVSGDEVRADAPVVQTPDTILAALAERNRVTLVTVREMNPKPPTVGEVLDAVKAGAPMGNQNAAGPHDVDYGAFEVQRGAHPTKLGASMFHVVHLDSGKTVHQTEDREEAKAKAKEHAEKQPPKKSGRMSVEEGRAHLAERAKHGAFGKSWDEIEKMQGGRLTRDLKASDIGSTTVEAILASLAEDKLNKILALSSQAAARR